MPSLVPEGSLVFEPEVRRLEWISPTRFMSMRVCALREVWSANRAPSLLPAAPAAHLGTVIHRLLEEAGQGAFNGDRGAAIDGRWRELLSRAEDEMRANWMERHLVPLSRSIRDFEVRRIQAIERAQLIAEAAPGPRTAFGGAHREAPLYGNEVPVSSGDRRVRGRIDEVAASPDGPIVRDYKSGNLFEVGLGDARKLKETYETQLRMYAALYASTSGKWPSRLELVPVAGTSVPVDFNREDCDALIQQARDALDHVNKLIEEAPSDSDRAASLANPQPHACAYCPYRPGCVPYRNSVREGEGWPHDLAGEVLSIDQLAGDHCFVTVRSGERTLGVRGLEGGARHPALESVRSGETIDLFNLATTGSPTTFTEGPLTVIYRLPTPSGREEVVAPGQPAAPNV